MPEFPQVTFTDVLIYTKEHVYIASVSDELAEKNIDHAAIFRWQNGKWAHKSVDVAICGMCALEDGKVTLLNMGVDGKAIEFLFPGEREEDVDISEDGPSDLLNLRCMNRIGSHVYVAGMARRVYRRNGSNQWNAVDQGTYVHRNKRIKAIGFNGIDGIKESSIFAVGYAGEIWHSVNGTWIQEESPTNVVLNCVKCISDNEVYIAGMAGMVIRGTAGEWEVLEQNLLDDDIWGITYFKGAVYISTYKGVYKIDGDQLVSVDMRLSKPVTTAYIDAADGVMWSVGHKDIVYTEDAVNWVIVNKP